MKKKATVMVLVLSMISLSANAKFSWKSFGLGAATAAGGYGLYKLFTSEKRSVRNLSQAGLAQNRELLKDLKGMASENNALIRELSKTVEENHEELMSVIEKDVVGRKETILFPYKKGDSVGGDLQNIILKRGVYDAIDEQFVGINNYDPSARRCFNQAGLAMKPFLGSEEFQSEFLKENEIDLIDINIVDTRSLMIADDSFQSNVVVNKGKTRKKFEVDRKKYDSQFSAETFVRRYNKSRALEHKSAELEGPFSEYRKVNTGCDMHSGDCYYRNQLFTYYEVVYYEHREVGANVLEIDVHLTLDEETGDEVCIIPEQLKMSPVAISEVSKALDELTQAAEVQAPEQITQSPRTLFERRGNFGEGLEERIKQRQRTLDK